MPPSKNLNLQVAEDFIKSLDETTDLVQQLIEDIRDGKIDFAAIKTELENLIERVREISILLKNNEVHIYQLDARLTLLENVVRDLKECLKNKEQLRQHEDASIKLANHSGRWQIVAVILTGALALITSLITLFINLYAH